VTRPSLRALVALVLAAATGYPAAAPLRVKASPAVAPCVAAAAADYARATGRTAIVETAAIGGHDSAAGADVVVAADDELNRVIESGATSPGLDVDVATIPWVIAAPADSGASEAASLSRGGAVVRVPRGVVAREVMRVLEKRGQSPARVERVRESDAAGAPRLARGELAIVPLSQAGSLKTTPLDVPPLTARALGVRASRRPEAARAFLEFLTGARGNAAFRTCGRPEAR
jgi:hypothetical protein